MTSLTNDPADDPLATYIDISQVGNKWLFTVSMGPIVAQKKFRNKTKGYDWAAKAAEEMIIEGRKFVQNLSHSV